LLNKVLTVQECPDAARKPKLGVCDDATKAS